MYVLYNAFSLLLISLRYCPLIDGVVAKGTSVLMVPIRGRGGLVVGVLIAAKPTADVPHSSKKR